jgi:hypothetical protein
VYCVPLMFGHMKVDCVEPPSVTLVGLNVHDIVGEIVNESETVPVNPLILFT